MITMPDPIRVASSFLEREAHSLSCLYCNLPRNLADAIYEWGRENITDDELWYFPEGDGGREETIHVTVKYGLHTNDFTDVQRFISQRPRPIQAMLGPVSLFEQDDHDVVKIDLVSPGLDNLNRAISQSFEITDSHPEYISHITVAYVKKGACKHLVDREDFQDEQVTFQSIVFSGHDGRKTTIVLPKLQ